MRIVITGGMGCGKSTIVKYLRSRLSDHEVFDVDACVRQLYDDDDVKKMLRSVFGTDDRRVISDVVFNDNYAKSVLYEMMNNLVFASMMTIATQPNNIIDMPLYFEMQDHHNFTYKPEYVICVSCSPTTQLQRIRDRDGFTDEKISSILSQQLPLSEKERRADFVVFTDTNVPYTTQLEKIFLKIGL